MAAATIAFLLHNDADSCSPDALLQHLQGVAATEDMQAKLALMRASLFQVGSIEVPGSGGWRGFFRSQSWARLTSVLSRMTYHDYATAGTEGVAVALWALVTSWGLPQQAVCMSAAFAGSAPVTSQLCGEHDESLAI